MPETHKENDKAKPAEIKLPKDAPEGSVVSDVGVTSPPTVFGGDGVTPKDKWEEAQKERREKNAEHDEKMRQRAVEHSGVIQTTAKHGVK